MKQISFRQKKKRREKKRVVLISRFKVDDDSSHLQAVQYA